MTRSNQLPRSMRTSLSNSVHVELYSGTPFLVSYSYQYPEAAQKAGSCGIIRKHEQAEANGNPSMNYFFSSR